MTALGKLKKGVRAATGTRQSPQRPTPAGNAYVPPDQQVEFELADTPNPRWRDSERGYKIQVTPRTVVTHDTSVFAMGSCFALEIGKALARNGVEALPKYGELAFDPETQHIGPFREWEQSDSVFRQLNYFDTFVIRQEFERALDPDAAPFEPVEIKPGAYQPRDTWDASHQDPYRQWVLGSDLDHTLHAMKLVDDAIASAIEAADVYVFTLGLTETWRDTTDGRTVWSVKVPQLSPEPDRFQFHPSTFRENYDNLHWVFSTLHERYPEKQIVLTVSPVALARTFTDKDVTVANMHSKSTLRAVAGAIDAEFDFVTYWPSYEIAMKMDLFKEDGRHVTRAGVDFIVENFLLAHGDL